ncbi:MAG: Cof-type HAD-IIB family hydrolase [Bacteroides sp.]|nr:Cof-type HAD-IIB family hydrolase [Bacteroides sp.]
MNKALFFDIDGTLVSFKTHEIPVSTIEALTTAKAGGAKIFIATGRPSTIITNLGALQERNLIDGYITMNGAYCFVGDEVIYKSAIPTPDIKALTDFCAVRSIPCIVVGEHRIFACMPDERVQQIFFEHLKVTAPIPDTPLEVALGIGEIFQLTPFITEEEEKEIAPYIPHCEIGRWHPAFVDVTALGNTKQKGMDEIIRYFDLRLEDTIAFGDGGNDIPMLRHAGIGVAMGNARDNVKAAADYVTEGVDEDGIAKAIKHFLVDKETS